MKLVNECFWCSSEIILLSGCCGWWGRFDVIASGNWNICRWTEVFAAVKFDFPSSLTFMTCSVFMLHFLRASLTFLFHISPSSINKSLGGERERGFTYVSCLAATACSVTFYDNVDGARVSRLPDGSWRRCDSENFLTRRKTWAINVFRSTRVYL